MCSHLMALFDGSCRQLLHLKATKCSRSSAAADPIQACEAHLIQRLQRDQLFLNPTEGVLKMCFFMQAALKKYIPVLCS